MLQLIKTIKHYLYTLLLRTLTTKIISDNIKLKDPFILYAKYGVGSKSQYIKSFGRKNHIDLVNAAKNIKKLNKNITAFPPVEVLCTSSSLLAPYFRES